MTAGLSQPEGPDHSDKMLAHGTAWPPNMVSMICWRGIAYSSAWRTVGFSSSRSFGFSGLELKPRLATSSPGWMGTVMPLTPSSRLASW